MGTHPIFESDFDCLTEHGFSSLTHRRPARPLGHGLLGRCAPGGQVRLELEAAPGPGCRRQDRATPLHWQYPLPEGRLPFLARPTSIRPFPHQWRSAIWLLALLASHCPLLEGVLVLLRHASVGCQG